MSRLRQTIGLFLLIALLIGCLWLLPRGGGRGSPGSVRTTSGPGAAALERWLTELGYNTVRMEHRQFELTAEDDAVFIITPSRDLSFEEAEEALRWVREDGGTLIFVSDEPALLLDMLEIEIDDHQIVTGPVPAAQPLAHPPVTGINVDQAYPIATQHNNGAPLLANEQGTLLLALTEGRGLIYISSHPPLVTNEGLRDQQNASVVLNLLNRVPAGGQVVFDEIHHGLRLQQNRPRNDPSPLTDSPLWYGAMYALLVLGLFILLTGRRFGRPVPLREELARRSSAEYVQSMAGLLERGRKTGYVLHHYKEQFKRRLAKPYGFSPRVPDADFVRELARFQSLDEARLLDLLRRMSHESPDAGLLLELVSEADRLAREIDAARSL